MVGDTRYDAFRLSLGSEQPPLKSESLQGIPLGFASGSIGCRDEHTLPKKLEAIAAAGFTFIELAFPDLLKFANQHLRPDQGSDKSNAIQGDDYDNLCVAGEAVKAMCKTHGLTIIVLQPFMKFEGWPEGSKERKDVWARVDGWIRIMEAVGTDMLQVGSSDAPVEQIGQDRARFVRDFQELADLMAKKNFRVAYENWCWSTHAPNWEDIWDICKLVDRPNFGLNLDTFQSAGGEWGDPSTASGLIEDGRDAAQVEKDWKASCARLSKEVPKEKIFYFQISDAYKVKKPFEKDAKDGGHPPRARWVFEGLRPLPFEGYLPVVDFTKAVLDTGYRSWFSYEPFDSGPEGEEKDYEMGVFAKHAFDCHEKLMGECVKASEKA